jgi:hypothetical protein
MIRAFQTASLAATSLLPSEPEELRQVKGVDRGMKYGKILMDLSNTWPPAEKHRADTQLKSYAIIQVNKRSNGALPFASA